MRGQAAGQRLAPGRRLHRREPHRGQAGGERVHADLGVDQHVEPGVGDGLRPAGQRRRARRRNRVASRRARAVSSSLARSSWNTVSSMRSRSKWRTQPWVIAFHTEWSRTCAAAMPTRSLRAPGRGRAGRAAGRRDAGGHQARGRLAVRQQQRPGIDRVVGEVERLRAAHGQRAGGGARGREPGIELGQRAREGAARGLHLRRRRRRSGAGATSRARSAHGRSADRARWRARTAWSLRRRRRRRTARCRSRGTSPRPAPGAATARRYSSTDSSTRPCAKWAAASIASAAALSGWPLANALAVAHRLVGAPGVHQRGDQRLVRRRQRGVELHRAAQALDGRPELALLAQEDAQVVVGLGVAGAAAHAGGEAPARAGGSPRLASACPRTPSAPASSGARASAASAASSARFGVAGHLAGDGQVQPALRIARPRLHARLEDGHRAAAVAGVDQRGAEQVGDLGRPGVARVGALQAAPPSRRRVRAGAARCPGWTARRRSSAGP